MIKVLVWQGWNNTAEEMTLKEFEELINKREYDKMNFSIEFIVK